MIGLNSPYMDERGCETVGEALGTGYLVQGPPTRQIRNGNTHTFAQFIMRVRRDV